MMVKNKMGNATSWLWSGIKKITKYFPVLILVLLLSVIIYFNFYKETNKYILINFEKIDSSKKSSDDSEEMIDIKKIKEILSQILAQNIGIDEDSIEIYDFSNKDNILNSGKYLIKCSEENTKNECKNKKDILIELKSYIYSKVDSKENINIYNENSYIKNEKKLETY